ncbi:MAG: hypothetical protein PVI43_00350 [Candidatus Bathyarchaeota archaeon]|jgi:hypothetical protein
MKVLCVGGPLAGEYVEVDSRFNFPLQVMSESGEMKSYRPEKLRDLTVSGMPQDHRIFFSPRCGETLLEHLLSEYERAVKNESNSEAK